MAITKIMCMKSAEYGNVAAHLKHSIAYICNAAKTEKGSLVGGINCLPDFAYEDLQDVFMSDMTKERYEALTDKEKVEWLGIAECSVQDAIQRFISKLDAIGVVYRYSIDMLDEFMRLESVVAQMNKGKKSVEKL